MQKLLDTEYHWKGFGNKFGNWDSFCRIRVFTYGSETIVVASDLGKDTGTSITNCAEHLATNFTRDCRQFVSEKSVWIHHYTRILGDFAEEDFDLVTFDIKATSNVKYPSASIIFSNPDWQGIGYIKKSAFVQRPNLDTGYHYLADFCRALVN